MDMADRYVPEIANEIRKTGKFLVAEVQTDRGLWTIRLEDLMLIKGKANTDEILEAKEKAEQIKSAPRIRKYQNLNKTYDNGFYKLKPGADIEIKYRDAGWQPAKFVKINSGGNITYERYGRQRHSSPDYVRIAEKVTK